MSFREAGWGYKYTSMLKDIRTVQGAVDVWERMKYVRRDRTISEPLYREREFERPFRYSTKFAVRGFNLETEQDETHYFWVHHDALMIRGDLEADVLTGMDEESPFFLIDNLMPIEGYLYR